MTKVKQIIGAILVGLPLIVLLNLSTPITLLLSVLRKQASIFSGVTLAGGEKLTFGYMLKHFSQKLEPMVLNTDQGKLLVIHGQKDGTMVLPEFSMNSNYEEVVNNLGLEGNYYIASCYNGCRSNYTASNVSLKRVPFTETPYPSIIWPYKGRVYICSSRAANMLINALEWLGNKLS